MKGLPESKEKRVFNNLLGALGNTPLVKLYFVITVMFFVLLGGSCTAKNNSSVPEKLGSTMVSKKDGMVLVYVPAGEFSMGSDNGNSDEKPVHKVTLDAFWIDQTEVTNAMYAKCVADGGACPPPSATRSEMRDDYYGVSEFDNYPVVYVNWSQANTYCSWAKRRLPTEAEWEKAARGMDGSTYPWGNNAPNVNLLNYNSNVGDTTMVGKYPNGKSFYGAYDMAGNVWEWVNDWYGKTYYKNSPASNPLGPDTDVYRVYRGGSWKGDYNSVRSAYRYGSGPSGTSDEIGFRCASSP
jgi:formylglycine-generating enzyme required for sulfatase activity